MLLAAGKEEAGAGDDTTGASEVVKGVWRDIPTDSLMALRLRGALIFLRWPVTTPKSVRVRLPRPEGGDVKGRGGVGPTGGTGSAAAIGKGPMSTPLSTPGGLTRFR